MIALPTQASRISISIWKLTFLFGLLVQQAGNDGFIRGVLWLHNVGCGVDDVNYFAVW